MANDTRGWTGPKFSHHLSYSWEKTLKKTSTRKTDLTRDQTQACYVIPWPQWWSLTPRDNFTKLLGGKRFGSDDELKNELAAADYNLGTYDICLILIAPRAWKIGYTQPCIKCRGKSATRFVYFWSRKTLPYTHLEAASYIPQQGQSPDIWTTSYLLQAITKISTLYNFMNGVYKPICYGNFKRWNWVSAWHYKN